MKIQYLYRSNGEFEIKFYAHLTLISGLRIEIPSYGKILKTVSQPSQASFKNNFMRENAVES